MWTCYTFTDDRQNTGNFMPHSFRIVCGFFNVPQNCEHSRVVRRGLRFIVLIREDICRCNYKSSTFSSVILRPWVLVRPESNSRPLAGQTVAQPMMKMNVVFSCCANWETFVADTKCFWTKSETFFYVPDTKFMSATNVSRAGKRGNICVGNNVSATMCPCLPGP